MNKGQTTGIKLVAKNRKAFHDYEVLEQIEAGLVLRGSEVKSLRGGKVSFQDAHVKIKNGEAWLVDLNIAPYEFATIDNHEPLRPRKLLLHRREIKQISARLERQGLTAVPLELYFTKGKAKVRVGVCKGRKVHDKREVLKKKEAREQMERELRRR